MNAIDVAEIMFDAGFTGSNGIIGLAVCYAETAGTLNHLITNTVGNDPPSVDRGLWQINSFWHAEVSDAVAFDPVLATKEAFRISLGGGSFRPWNAFLNGSYEKYLPIARVAWEAQKRLRWARGVQDGLRASLATSQTDLEASLMDLVDVTADLRQEEADHQTTMAALTLARQDMIDAEQDANEAEDKYAVLVTRIHDKADAFSNGLINGTS